MEEKAKQLEQARDALRRTGHSSSLMHTCMLRSESGALASGAAVWTRTSDGSGASAPARRNRTGLNCLHDCTLAERRTGSTAADACPLLTFSSGVLTLQPAKPVPPHPCRLTAC
jgi:hypothetical protein